MLRQFAAMNGGTPPERLPRKQLRNYCKTSKIGYVCSVRFVFDIRKAIAATAYVCELNDGKADLLKAIKTLYLAERQALLEWHRPITGDSFFSMDNGPIVSRIYDLMCGKVAGPEMRAWKKVFRPRIRDIVALKNLPAFKPLSRREKSALANANERLKDLSIGQVIDLVHALPEWEDPHGSSVPIDPKTIFYHENFGEAEVKEIAREISDFQTAKINLQSV
jgi:Protein of unknown function (DUF4065)